MKKDKSEISSKENAKINGDRDEIKIACSSSKQMIKKWNSEISELTYEEALNALDLLLENLQNDNIPVEDLQRHYLRGKIFLDHCEQLLNDVEQEVVEFDIENIKESSGN